MPRKRALTVADAGRRGGQANTASQQRARAQHLNRSGAPRKYRLVRGVLQRRTGEYWITLAKPYDARAQTWLRRQRSL